MKKYFAEFFSTFLMVLIGTLSIVINQETNGNITHLGICLTFGLIIIAMIYMFGPTSGAHMNPAVTIAMAAAKQLPTNMVLPYMVSQFTGAWAASAILYFLFPHNQNLGATNPSGLVASAFLLELVATFLLVYIIFIVAVSNFKYKKYAGIIIGATVGLEAYFFGPYCGASMNPARSFGPAIVNGNLQNLWLYFLAPIIGALLAFVCWQYLLPKKNKSL